MHILHGLFGLIMLAGMAWVISEKRSAVNWRTILAGLVMQILLAIILVKIPMSQKIFIWLNKGAGALNAATEQGTSMVFGYLGGAALPFDEKHPGMSYILAFRGLPLVLVVSALSALLFHWKVLPWIVRGFSKALQKSMRIGGVEGLGTVANIFVGMVEAPLLVKPYLAKVSRSELFTIMVSGMATIAGTVMILYATILSPVLPDSLGQLLAASLISAPAAIIIAKLMVPETEPLSKEDIVIVSEAQGAMDAITQGTMQGVKLLINIVAMLVVLVALVHLVNLLLGLLPPVGQEPITFQRLAGWLFAPVVWVMGVPWAEAATAGSLMGIKTVLNELLAYIHLAQLPADALSLRSRMIMIYALCGFANFGSLGIMLGGLCSMVPERRQEIVGLGMKSILAGTLATCMTGTVIGLLY